MLLTSYTEPHMHTSSQQKTLTLSSAFATILSAICIPVVQKGHRSLTVACR